MSFGGAEGGDDLIANRDTESPEEVVQPASSEIEKTETPPPAEPDPLPSNPSPSEDPPPAVTSASPEPLLTREEDDSPVDGGGSGDQEPTAADPVVLANPVFDEKVEAKIELQEVAKESSLEGKKTEEVVGRDIVEKE